MRRAALVLLISACGIPPVVDPAGLPVRRPLLVAAVADGWVMVDSSAARVRAVAELTRAVRGEDASGRDAVYPVLRCGESLSVALLRVRREPAVCRQPDSPSACASGGGGGGGGGSQCRNRAVAAPSCAQVVRAEFALDRLPRAGDSVVFVHGSDTSRTRWSRP